MLGEILNKASIAAHDREFYDEGRGSIVTNIIEHISRDSMIDATIAMIKEKLREAQAKLVSAGDSSKEKTPLARKITDLQIQLEQFNRSVGQEKSIKRVLALPMPSKR